MDGSGENAKFRESAEKEGFNINFQITPRSTPQFNGVFERAFAYVLARLRAMNLTAKLSDELKSSMWGEGVVTATKLENILTRKGGSKSSYSMFHGE